MSEEESGFTLWFTGLSGSGKSTNSYRVYVELRSRGLPVELLDGDIIRTNFSQGLGFSRRDRDINVKRIGFVSYLLNRHGIHTIVAAISPYRQTRRINRALLPKYIEVFCDCSLDVLKERDPKGLYVKALAGEIDNFTGVSDPYEAPDHPEILLQTDEEDHESSYEKVMRFLETRGYVPMRDACTPGAFRVEEEMASRQHLLALGFANKLADL